jgi:hypothetical protein
MPDKTIIPVLAAYLWDLRAQCESQLRSLTVAQRLLDQYRDAPTDSERSAATRELRADLREVVRANTAIRDSASEALRQAEILPERGINGDG